MTTYEIIEYRRLRAHGWRAAYALRAARIRAAFAEAEDRGLVRIVCEPECEYVDDFLPDYSGERDRVRLEKEWREYIDSVGLWMYAAQYRRTPNHAWETAESIGGVEGNWLDYDCDIDCKRAALDALDRAYADEAAEIAERATYAAGGFNAYC